MKRRVVRFATFDEVLAEAERLHRKGYRRTGNWSLGQICNHLAQAIDITLGLRTPKPIQRVAIFCFLRLAFLGRIGNLLGLRVPTTRPQTEPVGDEAGIAQLKDAIARLQQADARHLDGFHLWHSGHHLGFLIPGGADSP